MKRLIFLNGAMGAGKTCVSQALLNRLPACAMLDGDWCWMMRPFVVNDETKKMVLSNAAHLLRSFLDCSAIENVVFCWVMQSSETIEELLGRIGRDGYEFSLFTLSVFEGELRRRLNADIAAGKREEDITERAVSYLPYFERMKGRMINTDGRTSEECAEEIAAILSGKE